MNEGDQVTVVMSRNDVFPWQDSPSFEATLIRRPAGPGDTFAVQINSRIIQINGNSSEFVGIYT